MPAPSKFLRGQWDAVATASAVLLAFSFFFGGSTQNHALRLAFVELAALPLLVIATGRLIQTNSWRDHKFALGLLVALVAIPLIQLVPLPPAIWTKLPGRDSMALALELADMQPGWSTLSMAPEHTWRSFLALTPTVAFFVATLSMSHKQRERLIYFCIAAAVIGIVLGAAQLVSGGSKLYLWSWTDPGSVNGFFANRNHFASSLLATLPFAVAIGAAALRRDGRNAPLWIGALFAALVVVALAAIRSRAGIALLAPAMVGSLLAAWIAAGRGRPRPALLLVAGTVCAALMAVALLALPPILARFDTAGAPEGRFDRWPLVAETAQTYLPLGTGIGSFDAVYRSVEPLGQLDHSFFNQAHNDYLETWLETGWLGIAFVITFFVWFCRRSWAAWKATPSREGDLQRAASVAIGVVLLHSAADYPLRTITVAVVFALCCGLLELAAKDP